MLPIKNYIIAILLVATLSLGWSTYHLTGELAVSEANVSEWQDKANKNAEAARTAGESCALSLQAVGDTQRAVDALNESRMSDLEALNTVPHITLQETKVNASTTPTAPPTRNADDIRLSPDTMRLLDNAYCSGDKDDPYCTTR